MREESRRRFLGTTALFAWLALSGCASVQGSARLEGIKTVGVISAVADRFTFTPAGLTGPDSIPRSFSIDAWGVDEQIVSRASSVLSQHFQVQVVTYPREAFSAPEHLSSIPGADLVREDPFKELVRNRVLPQGLDAYVVITKATLKYGARGVPLSGIGLIRQTALFDSFAIAHALYVIRVIDGHTFSTIDKKSASPVDNSTVVRLAGPSRMFDAAGLAAVFDPVSNEPLKATISDLVERSLEPTLRDLRLALP
jgi:hypothetical protein